MEVMWECEYIYRELFDGWVSESQTTGKNALKENSLFKKQPLLVTSYSSIKIYMI